MNDDLYNRMDCKRLKDKLFTLDCPRSMIEQYENDSTTTKIGVYTALINMYEANGKRWKD